MVQSVDEIWRREIGERLRLLAKAVGITHDQEIANELDVGKTNWGNWRRGDIMATASDRPATQRKVWLRI